MLYFLTHYLSESIGGFRVFDYLTMRAIMAVLTALIFSFLMGPAFVRWLLAYKIGQSVRDDGPQTHLTKSGTPTMGGIMILSAITVATLLWMDLHSKATWIALLVMLGCGVVGFVDDYKKIKLKNAKGLSAPEKYLSLTAICLGASAFIYFTAQTPTETTLFIPFLKHIGVNLGILFIPWAYLVMVGTSNAVNLTDGLDGLAILPTALVASALAVFAYVTGNIKFATYLELEYVAGVGELGIFCAAIAGAGLGFLWFNTYPAQMFMGDVGALGLGAALGAVAVLVRQELILVVMGGVFVAEAMSVMLQVGSFKLRGKRIFKMAPLHHHFELSGWKETQVVVRFWIVTLILVLIGLASLKIR